VFLDSPTPSALKIADKIAEQCDNAALLMVRKTYSSNLLASRVEKWPPIGASQPN